ncbi:MAG: hypothetical protein WBB98_15245 [Xanthobacteraceae bacterium]
MRFQVGEAVSFGSPSDTEDQIALKFERENSEPLTPDFPVSAPEEFSFFLAQLAHLARQKAGPLGRAPALPVHRMEAGLSDEGQVVLQLHYPKLGIRGFRFDRQLATERVDMLQSVLAQKTPNPPAPN